MHLNKMAELPRSAHLLTAPLPRGLLEQWRAHPPSAVISVPPPIYFVAVGKSGYGFNWLEMEVCGRFEFEGMGSER